MQLDCVVESWYLPACDNKGTTMRRVKERKYTILRSQCAVYRPTKQRTGQLVHSATVLVPPVLYWPAAHSSHAVEPVDSASKPPLHSTQELALEPL